MPKKITNDKSFLKFAQKKYNISDKEMAESEIWIDGFKNALKSVEKVGAFAKWQPILKAPKDGTMLFLISIFDDEIDVSIAYWSAKINDWSYAPMDTQYHEPTHFALIEYPRNNPVSKQYKTQYNK
jgi:hypothetical protein